MKDVNAYEAWYHTPRGAWIGDVEFQLLMRLLQPFTGASLLDVGCGTGYFSRRFAASGLNVTGMDLNRETITFANRQQDTVRYVQGSALDLPFNDNSFDYVTSVTGLCFIEKPEAALQEMWRVCRYGVVLGLLNQHSLLYYQKRGQKSGTGGYQGARWDTYREVHTWLRYLKPVPVRVKYRSAVYLPQGGMISRAVERVIPGLIPLGSFLVAYFSK